MVRKAKKKEINNINSRILNKITKVRKIKPANGFQPHARFSHKSVIIGTDEGQKPYLVTYGGLDANRNIISSMLLFDITNEIWIPLAQLGFIPHDDQLDQFGRYNCGMTYDHQSNQILIFGG